MFKWIGAVLLICGTTGFGISLKRDMLERVRQLKYMLHILELMKSEIGYYREALPQVCRLLGEKVQSPYDVFFRQIAKRMEENDGTAFATVWQEESKALTDEMPLSKEEKEMWGQLCGYMGYADKALQENALMAQQEEWKRRIRTLEAEAVSKGKLYTSLGAACGLLLTIILF